MKAKVGTKSNSYREPHIDAHSLFARNKIRSELVSLYSNDIDILSVDEMSKIKVGPPAVSRCHQIKRIYPTNDAPNLNDHDFPLLGYLINVFRHMFLEKQTDELHPEQDRLLQSPCYHASRSSSEPNFDSMEVEDLDDNNIYRGASSECFSK